MSVGRGSYKCIFSHCYELHSFICEHPLFCRTSTETTSEQLIRKRCRLQQQIKPFWDVQGHKKTWKYLCMLKIYLYMSYSALRRHRTNLYKNVCHSLPQKILWSSQWKLRLCLPWKLLWTLTGSCDDHGHGGYNYHCQANCKMIVIKVEIRFCLLLNTVDVTITTCLNLRHLLRWKT